MRSYNVMAQSSLSSSSLSSSSVEIWFPWNNFSCGWPIVMKFWYDVCNYYRKVGIDFGGYGPYRFSKRGQKGGKWVFFKNHSRMIILHVILVILFALYSWSNSVNKMCQRISWDLDRFKVMGVKKGQRPKNQQCFSNRFLITLKVSELLGAKGAKNASLKGFVKFLFFTWFEWFFFSKWRYIQKHTEVLQQIGVNFYYFNIIDSQI